MDDIPEPEASIVIATYNRAQSVVKTLRALADQSVAPATFEVIIVSDGSTDRTPEIVGELSLPFPLRIIEQVNNGPASARNAGAEIARGGLIIFLDDDITPSHGFVASHLDRHRKAPCQPFVLVGYLPVRLTTQRGAYATSLRGWWETMFDRLADPAYRFGYRDVLSGNMSLSSTFFRQVGGFEPELKCHEDFELGYRLIQAGACFGFSRQARGAHEEKTDLVRSLRRQREEGIAEVWLAKRYPSIIKYQRFTHYRSSGAARIAHHLAFSAPWLALLLSHGALFLLALADRLRFRRVWRRLCNFLLMQNYWKGVAIAVEDHSQLDLLVSARIDESEACFETLEIDLACGLIAAEGQMNRIRPQSLLLRWGRIKVGTVPHEEGRERLHAAHLRPLLQHRFRSQLLRAAGLEALLTNAGWYGKPGLVD